MIFMRHCHWMAGLVLGVLTFACCTQAPSKKGTSDVKTQAYGKMPDGAPIELYTLSNPNGMQAGIMTYGGTVVTLTAPDRSGKFADVVLGADSVEGDCTPH